MCAENLLLGGDQAEQDLLLGNLLRETTRVSRLVTSLLQIADQDEGETLDRSPCDFVSVCKNEVDRAWSVAPHLDFRLRVEGVSTIPPNLDANKVREILANILDNAKRHALQRVEVLVREADNWLEMVISDDGGGVPAGMEETIFDRFFSIGETGGSGLGLAIAQQLARAHGGNLSYGSSGFVLSLPTGRDER